MSKEKKGFNKNTILALIAVPILMALGVVIGSYLSDIDNNSASGAGEQQELVEETTVPLEEFLLNLELGNNTGQFIRMEVSLSTVQEDGVTTIEENLEKIRDTIIHTVSTQPIEEIFNDQSGTVTLKNLLKQSINNLFDEDIIYDVYITNIVMQ